MDKSRRIQVLSSFFGKIYALDIIFQKKLMNGTIKAGIN